MPHKLGSRKSRQLLHLLLAIEMQHWPTLSCESDARRMDIDQAAWFLRVFVGRNNLNPATVSELYLSGYIGIELLSPGKEPLPTLITSARGAGEDGPE